MSARPKFNKQTYAATWGDVDHWCQAMYRSFGCQTRVEVKLPGGPYQLKPCVAVTVFQPLGHGQMNELSYSYQVLSLETPHHAEHLALQMLSAMWLELDRMRDAAEQQAPLF